MLENHPQRTFLAKELHTRPFPKVNAPTSVAYLAVTAQDTPDQDRQALIRLLGLLGKNDKIPEDNHYSIALETCDLKWERHTEFVTYTLFLKRKTETVLFSDNPHDLFPKEWMRTLQSQVLTSCFLEVAGPLPQKAAENFVTQDFYKFFAVESLAVNYVLGKDAVVASDFTIDGQNHIRMSVLAIGQVGENRLGRIVQRLLEIETYKTLSMLTLPVARDIFAEVGALNTDLTHAVRAIAEGEGTSQDRLEALLSVSAKIEYLQSQSAYRFSAVEAYNAIVNQRIEVLREERLQGRQTFSEFMMRRFDPAMRTCRSAQSWLQNISSRAARASDLLATRVTVRTNEQNRILLAQMDRRASLQLRLQETVEGLSVVAITYYAVNLATYFLLPLTKKLDFEKWHLSAALVLPMLALVWIMVRQIRRRTARDQTDK